ncbi:hypothetical protein [Streptomyces noursei]
MVVLVLAAGLSVTRAPAEAVLTLLSGAGLTAAGIVGLVAAEPGAMVRVLRGFASALLHS